MIYSNMTSEAINAQREAQQSQQKLPQTQNGYDPSRYLNVSIPQGLTRRFIKIRLLPYDSTATTPFLLIKAHNKLEPSKKTGKMIIKPYICAKTQHSDAECPFCEMASKAWGKHQEIENTIKMLASQGEQYPGQLSMLKKESENTRKIAIDNFQKDKCIVRCIERGKESEGVKWWMFDFAKNGKGIYQSIMNLYDSQRELGGNPDIFDLNTGCDLVISMKLDENGKTVRMITLDNAQSPLSIDENLAQSWINDTMTWDKMWTVKPLDYLRVLVNGGQPVFDKALGCYVDANNKTDIPFQQVVNNVMSQPIQEQTSGSYGVQVGHPYPITDEPRENAVQGRPWEPNSLANQTSRQLIDKMQQPWESKNIENQTSMQFNDTVQQPWQPQSPATPWDSNSSYGGDLGCMMKQQISDDNGLPY